MSRPVIQLAMFGTLNMSISVFKRKKNKKSNQIFQQNVLSFFLTKEKKKKKTGSYLLLCCLVKKKKGIKINVCNVELVRITLQPLHSFLPTQKKDLWRTPIPIVIGITIFLRSFSFFPYSPPPPRIFLSFSLYTRVSKETQWKDVVIVKKSPPTGV